MEFKKNQQYMVAATAPHHANRIGFFQFVSKTNSVVLSTEPINKDHIGSKTLFVVDKNNLIAQNAFENNMKKSE